MSLASAFLLCFTFCIALCSGTAFAFYPCLLPLYFYLSLLFLLFPFVYCMYSLFCLLPLVCCLCLVLQHPSFTFSFALFSGTAQLSAFAFKRDFRHYFSGFFLASITLITSFSFCHWHFPTTICQSIVFYHCLLLLPSAYGFYCYFLPLHSTFTFHFLVLFHSTAIIFYFSLTFANTIFLIFS